METRFRMTTAARAVAHTLLKLDDDSRYGLEVCKQSGHPSGVVYPILARMVAAGWLADRLADTDPQHPYRPRRRYYTFTPVGLQMAKFRLGLSQET